MGWLDPQREPKGQLVRIEGAGAPAGSPVGTPVIAHNGRGIGVAFADRAAPADPWNVRLGFALGTDVPKKTQGFVLPAGGPGGNALAPGLAGLSDGRWLLVWTEGSAAARQEVRAQTLGRDMSPLGAPFVVSRPGTNAGQGAVALGGARGAVAFLEGKDPFELWATSIDCR